MNVKMHAALERWPLLAPFTITGYTWDCVEVLVVRLELEGFQGRAEAAGVYYKGDTPAAMLQQLESLRRDIEGGLDRDRLQHILPAGGARNALDCALWELEARIAERPVWRIAGLDCPRPLLTTFTCGADTPERMALAARRYQDARALKLKLTGDPSDADRVRSVREARQDVWMAVDANQGFTREGLEKLIPVLIEARVSLIEQPLRVGQEALLDGFNSPVPLAADESLQTRADLPSLVGRFNMVNIKLDKCGGLTQGLEIARAARNLGLQVMVGNMMGTSLAMAPAFLVGQLCDVVDLDGPAFLEKDRPESVHYEDGRIDCPDNVWGS